MADRYWVGGTASWDGTAGTKWATTSGGTGGASVPTSSDNVFFDANSGSGTVTVSANANCLSLNCTGFTGIIAGTSSIFINGGSLTLGSGMTWTNTGSLSFSANSGSYSITLNGVSISSPVTLGSSGISTATWTLQSAFTSSAAITLTSGTFTTNDFNVTATSLASNNSNARTINLGSSTVTLIGGGTIINFATSTNLTFNSGTSEIISTAAGAVTINGGNLTFYNVSFTGTNSGTTDILGNNTFNNLSITAPSSAGVRQLAFNSNQTINGTLSTTGTAGNRRVWFRSDTYGVRRTLTINSAPSLTDADFRDIIVNGTAAPISGTRIGNRGACTGITFSAPKTVYWNLAGTQNWSANGWASTSGGTPNTDNFPLPQDTAVFNNAGSITQLNLDSAIGYVSTVDMSPRTSSIVMSPLSNTICYGSWANGSNTSFTNTATLTFSGEGTKTITSAGKTFSCPITIDAYGGTVELADALNLGSQALTVTNGTFDTKGFAVTAGALSSNNTNVRTIKLGSSTLTLSAAGAITFSNSANLTFDAGTSQINVTTGGADLGNGLTLYNISFLNASGSTRNLSGSSTTFNNVSITTNSAGLAILSVGGNITVNGTLTVAGSSATQRAFVRSNSLGTTRTITANAISANDCDFRDITIAGSAAGASPTRAGNCGGNSGINFPAPKTVYWNLGGTVSWGATGWATSSGGTPAVNNFPLAQDTAVFDNAGTAATVSVQDGWNVGTVNASSRTNAMTLSYSATTVCYGDYTLGSGVTIAGNNGQTFSGRGTQTFTSAGKTITFPITVDSFSGTFQLGDAYNASNSITLTSGTLDAVTYNVTATTFSSTSTTLSRTLRMGSGLWTLSGTGTLWNIALTNFNFFKGTADILLSNNTTTARTFGGATLSYNKLTIGGNTSTSTTTINDNNQFTELASTKTVAHTIDLGTTTQTFGKWTVTGSAGNVVTLSGTGTSHVLAGSCTSGIDYLAMGSIGFAPTSPAEFYAGANSTGTAGAPVYRTAKPADSTRYWVGGTGNWSDTARWSTSSGGAGGASVPRSHDDVVFDTLSNLTAYTATVNAVTGGIRCKSLTIAPPATGNITLAGSTAIDGIHGDVTLPATGLTRTYTGAITLSGSTTGKTFTTNGVTLASAITVNGVGCGWTLGSALNIGSASIIFTNGSFDTGNFNVTAGALSSNNANTRLITLGSSTVNLDSTGNVLTFTNSTNLTFNAGTSQLNLSSNNAAISGGSGQTFYNVSFTSTASTTGVKSISANNTFNNLTISAPVSSSLNAFAITGNQTINGTLTLSAGTNATCRTFVRSDTIGTTRTLTCNAVASLTDIDFRDITIAGAAAPVSGTRLGDCGGNSGITFPAPKTVYWNLAGSQNWSATGWATSSGGTPAVNNFPLAQDTAVFDNTGSAGTVSIQTYNIGTVDASNRTSAMTLNYASAATFYGSHILGSGVALSGSGATSTFSGRGTMTFTSAGKTITFPITVDTPTGTFQLGDAFNSSNTITHTRGTIDAVTYNLTAVSFQSNSSNTRTINMGSGLWTMSGSGGCWEIGNIVGVTLNKGTANLLFSDTSTTQKSLSFNSLAYNKVTLGGATGIATFAFSAFGASFTEIASIKTVAHTIALATSYFRVGAFTVTGTAGNVVTITGNTSNMIYTGSGAITGLDYLNVQGRVYGSAGQITDVWYAGANSVNSGSLGWVFAAGVTPPPSANSNFFLMFA